VVSVDASVLAATIDVDFVESAVQVNTAAISSLLTLELDSLLPNARESCS